MGRQEYHLAKGLRWWGCYHETREITQTIVMHVVDEEETSNVYVNGDIMNWDGDIYHRVK